MQYQIVNGLKISTVDVSFNLKFVVSHSKRIHQRTKRVWSGNFEAPCVVHLIKFSVRQCVGCPERTPSLHHQGIKEDSKHLVLRMPLSNLSRFKTSMTQRFIVLPFSWMIKSRKLVEHPPVIFPILTFLDVMQLFIEIIYTNNL